MNKLCYMICLVPLLAMTSCARENPTIQLVFPDGFRGVAILRWQQPNGEKLVAVNNTFLIEIPPTGTLAIQGKNLMRDWYVQQARYASGAPLKEGDQHTKDDQGINLRANRSTVKASVPKMKNAQGDFSAINPPFFREITLPTSN